MKNITLNNGIEMPILGFGVYQMEPEQCEQAVCDAIENGYRLIDTASGYMNEEAVGRAIKRCGIPREELFITTKLWIQDQGYGTAKVAFEKSMKRLQLDYLDLYLIHQPYGDNYGSWKAMEELYRAGRTRAIGVSNFLPDVLVDFIMFNEIVPAVNQVETNPFHQQVEAQKVMQEYNVQIQSWSPFVQGQNNMFQNDVLSGIASKHSKTVAQIVLRWLVQREVVVLAKSVRKERIVENFKIFDFELTAQEMEEIAALDTGASPIFDHRKPENVKMLGSVRFDI